MPDQPSTQPAEIDPFDFLFPASGRPRFKLEAPDLFESCWSLWDRQQKLTLCRDKSPRECVRQGIQIAQNNGFGSALA